MVYSFDSDARSVSRARMSEPEEVDLQFGELEWVVSEFGQVTRVVFELDQVTFYLEEEEGE